MKTTTQTKVILKAIDLELQKMIRQDLEKFRALNIKSAA